MVGWTYQNASVLKGIADLVDRRCRHVVVFPVSIQSMHLQEQLRGGDAQPLSSSLYNVLIIRMDGWMDGWKQ